MFHVRVAEVSERRMSELVPVEEGDTEHDFMEVFREPLDRECVEFSVGNPRVEHITGIVHLYKRNTAATDSSSSSSSTHYGRQGQPWKGPAAAAAAAAAAAELEEASLTLCCLAIPADMSVANFCTFIGAYLREVRSIQVLRREGSQPSVCMVLLTFAAQEQADGFYADFNAVPFSSLEPDILCRLVYVRDVEVLSSRGRPPSGMLPATAKALTVATSAKPSGSPKEAAAPADAAAGKLSSSPKAAAAASDEAAAAGAQQADKGAAASAGQQSSSEPAGSGPSQLQGKQAKQQAGAGSSSAKQASAPEGGGASYAAAVSGAATPPTATTPTASSSAAAAAAAAAGSQQWLEPPPGTTELPTCPVCLERLDEHISGVVTTVCNHRFHGECLKHWGDTSCPVCRYCMLSSNTSTSRCNTCGAHSNLWICLICGHVGCGRYKQGHANDHWQASAHCYALELETQRVWDYAGDGYVHRLIQSKTDGKLVEVPSPAPTCPHGSPGHHHHRRSSRCSHQAGGRPGGSSSRAGQLGHSRSGSSAAAAGGSGAGGGACSSAAGDWDEEGEACGDASCPVCADEAAQMKEAMVTSKLEVITLEYNHLLASQLDSQRQYFEGLLAQHDAKQQGALAAARAAAEAAQASSAAAAASAKESERKRQQLERKLVELTGSISKVSEEREFLRSLNETLLSNQKEFSSKLRAAQAEAAEKDKELLDLQEQVRDLMVFIEAQRTIQAEGGSELQDATLLPMPQSKGGSRGGSRRTSKK